MARAYRLLPLALLLLLANVFNLGCGSDEKARVRVVHASPDAPNVDVLVDGRSVLTNVPYATASDYLTVSAGARQIEARATGTSQDAINAKLTLAGKQDYTVLAEDFLADITASVLTDHNSAPDSGKVKVRVVHASPSAGPVDVYVVAPGTGIGTASPTISNLAFKSATDYLSVPAGSYEVFVTPTGTKTIAIDTGSVALVAGQVRTAVALDAPGGGLPLTAILLADLN
jgi:hypothetical protein